MFNDLEIRILNWKGDPMKCKTKAEMDLLYRSKSDDDPELAEWLRHLEECPSCADRCGEFWVNLFSDMISKALAPSN